MDRSLIPDVLMCADSSSPLVLYEALEVCFVFALNSHDQRGSRFSQGILHACLVNSHLSLEKFSRWLRSICTILLSQGTVADRSKAIQYVEQASAVLEEHGNLVENGSPVSISLREAFRADGLLTADSFTRWTSAFGCFAQPTTRA